MFNIFKHPGVGLMWLLLAAVLVAGCRPKTAGGPTGSSGYFQTPFQSESQFIVEAIISDLAEQITYAASGRLPDKKQFSVKATEKRGSPQDAPVYEVQVRLGGKAGGVKFEVNINGPIWSGAVYQGAAGELAKAVGLRVSPAHPSEDTRLLSNLTDGTAATIERENQRISAALGDDFANPELHEQAALLLGAFLLRDHSGNFFEIRSPLCRLTAHLALAQFLRGAEGFGVNGRVAEAMLLTLLNDQAPALERLNALGTNDAAAAPLARALRVRNMGDYRPLEQVSDRTPVESLEWFFAKADSVSTPVAWLKLSNGQKQTVDFVRVANQVGYSVEVGHELLRASIVLEAREVASVYALTHREALKRRGLVEALNALPERCFSESGGKVQVRVIGWGQWANFLQRHLCHAVQQNFEFMHDHWGVPDQAKEFAAGCEKEFGGLRLYPFVRRFVCTDVAAYHKAVDDSFKVTVATPHLVPAECWNYLCYSVEFAPLYKPNPNPHINEWHSHNPPPGTVYDLCPRLNHPSLVSRADAGARFEQLHQLAPYDANLAYYVLKQTYKGHPTYDQALAWYGALLPYSVTALEAVARTVRDQPERYEKLMLQAAELNPGCYYVLADYVLQRQQEDKAAQYIDKACAADPDSVRVSNRADWRVRYYLKKGQTEKARRIADEAGEVYSFTGLEAKAIFLEETKDYAGAFGWYAKIEERYNDPSPLLLYCARYQARTGDSRFEPELKKRMGKLFPKGIEKVSLSDFHDPPSDGVVINEENGLVRAAGLKMGDVIVAVYGLRVHNFRQYNYGRESRITPQLDLIVWHNGGYREFKPSPPRHRFGVNFGDYRRR